MQVILLYLFFLIAQSCGFAQETSIHYSEDNNLLEADVKKFRFVEENQVPNNESIDNKTVNVEDLQRQLRAEKAKNRDLNQTISDILDRLADVEKNIIRNEEKITENQSSVVLLTRDVEDLQEEVDVVQSDVAAVQGDVAAVQGDVAAVQGNVTAVQDDVAAFTGNVERNSADITTLGVRGHWCAEQNWWDTVGTITYDSITYSDSNMNISDTPLDINTGINSHKCY